MGTIVGDSGTVPAPGAALADGVRQMIRHEAARKLYYPLSLYEQEHGTLPHSPLGPEYALYRLKDYLPRCTPWPEMSQNPARSSMDLWAFDLQYLTSRENRTRWDEEGGRVVNIDYDYLNEARSLDRTAPSFAVYAEKRSIGGGGRWVVFSNGARLWVTDQNPLVKEVLGKSWSDLSSAEPTSVTPPVGKLGEHANSNQGAQMQFLFFALEDYVQDHGVLPYSERGADYALYQLKPYVWSAVCFDAAYTRLENGVAYWDEKEGRLANGDFEYLNQPLPKQDLTHKDEAPGYKPWEDAVVIIAGKWGALSPTWRWIHTSFFGGADQVERGTPHADDPLGRKIGELEPTYVNLP